MVRLQLGLRGLDRLAAHRDPDPFVVFYTAKSGVWELSWSTAPRRKTTDPVFAGEEGGGEGSYEAAAGPPLNFL